MPTFHITPHYDRVLGLPLIHVGKVRELYELPDQPDRMLMVATDNVSAFDWVLDSQIPDKGAILNQLSLWWFDQLREVVPNHIVSTDVPEAVAGRAVIVEKLEMLPVECVARGYLTGSGWKEYRTTRSVCGLPLPEGLTDGARLPEPLFTPATKAAVGDHDENVDFTHVVGLLGEQTAQAVRDLTLQIYAAAEQIARDKGIILADTKFEFGRRTDGTIVLADEVLTPDSSRFWEAAMWPDSLASFDKQFVRDWLAKESGWDPASEAAPPVLPQHIITATRQRYGEAFERLTGAAFVPV